jgi:hypothetical protein
MSSLSSRNLNEGVNVTSKSAIYANRYARGFVLVMWSYDAIIASKVSCNPGYCRMRAVTCCR